MQLFNHRSRHALEREREAPLPPLMAVFKHKTHACLARLDDEAQALIDTPLTIGQIAIGCALGYLDYRFEALHWRSDAPRLTAWYAMLARAHRGRRPNRLTADG